MLLYKKMDKKVKMDWRRWASIARLSIWKIVASMATENRTTCGK